MRFVSRLLETTAMRRTFPGFMMIAISLATGCDRQEERLLSPNTAARDESPPAPKAVDDPVADKPPWNLLGKPIDGPEVNAFLEGVAESPEKSFVKDYGTFVSFHQTGIELSSNVDGQLMTIVVYSPDDSRYGEYQSELPYSLDWSMPRKDVERQLGGSGLGAFYHSSANNQDQFSAEYPHLGLYLTYIATSKDDMQARLLDIRRKAPH